ncbi:MAG: hypothetical protein N2Z74_07045, partial [Syntrophales bacterium]|nr:hypothetical protein [Syntrophales bacterium]
MYGSCWFFNGTTISGNAGENGTFDGYLVGLWRNGTIKAKIISLYAKADGKGGYLESVGEPGAGAFHLAGSYYPALGMWEIPGGSLKANDKGNIAAAETEQFTFTGNSGLGTFTAGGALRAYTAAGDPIRVSGARWGIWNAGFGGTYSGTTGNDWVVRLGGMYRNNEYDYNKVGYTETGYWLGKITGQSWDDVELGGTYAGEALTNKARYTFDGDIIGSHQVEENRGLWQAAGIGTFNREELLLSASSPANVVPYLSRGVSFNDDGVAVRISDLPGIFGVVDVGVNPKGPDRLYAIGEWKLMEQRGTQAGKFLWATDIKGGDVTSQGQLFPLLGLAAGLWQEGATPGNGLMKGYGLAVYQNYLYNTAGIMETPLTSLVQPFGMTGNYYRLVEEALDESHYGAGMWRLEGDMVSRDMPIPEGTVVSDYTPAYGSLSAALDGTFAGTTDSVINAQGSGALVYLSTEAGAVLPWGIFTVQLYGDRELRNTFSGRPTGQDAAWQAVVGGKINYNYVYGPHTGYWLATVKGNWSDDGLITGMMGAIAGDSGTFGRYLTFSHYGTMKGPFYGINLRTTGTWIGQGIGTYEGAPVFFSSALDGRKY